MEKAHDISNIPQIPDAKIAILCSKWYDEYVGSMLKACTDILEKSNCSKPDIHILPGSLEMPLAAQRLAREKFPKYDAIICFGIIMKGETFHFEMIMSECIRGIGSVMLSENIPIIVEILPVTNIEQVKLRCSGDDHNKGIEAALAAIEIIHWNRINFSKSN